jgi:hypothetical protein
MPAGYSAEIQHLVKSVGSTAQPLIVVSSYPTMTTVQPEFGTVDDMSNRSMRSLFAKLGLDRLGAKNSILHIDETPHRIDKPTAERACGRSLYKGNNGDRLPVPLRRTWE